MLPFGRLQETLLRPLAVSPFHRSEDAGSANVSDGQPEIGPCELMEGSAKTFSQEFLVIE